jgi:type IV pilus assembly protein PilB
MVPARVRLGELLVEAQIVSRAQLEEVLAAQKRDGRRIGTMLVEAGLVTETQVTQILSQQLSVPWVSLYHIDFSRQLLNLVSHQLAERFCLVPIFVRRVRGLGETLYVAMDDPSDEAAQREVAQWAGLPVRAMIAPPTDIRSAIRVYYGIGKDTASLSEAVAEVDAENAAGVRSHDRAKSAPPHPAEVVSVKPTPLEAEVTPAMVPAAPAVRVPSERPAEEADEPASFGSPVALSARLAAPDEPTKAARISEAPDSGPQIEAREIAMPRPKKGGANTITLTLLDGSKVNLPAREAAQRRAPKRRSLPPTTNAEGGELTARDLIAALRAVSHGADATEILGDNVHWEALFSALLSLLLKKHLIADWEFVEEYKKV